MIKLNLVHKPQKKQTHCTTVAKAKLTKANYGYPLLTSHLLLLLLLQRDGQRQPSGSAGARLRPAAAQGPQHAHREEVAGHLHAGHLHARLLHPPGHAGRTTQRQHQSSRLRPQRSLQDEQLPRQPAPLQRRQVGVVVNRILTVNRIFQLLTQNCCTSQIHDLRFQSYRRADGLRQHASPQRPIAGQTLQHQSPGQPVPARLHPETGEPITSQQHQGPERQHRPAGSQRPGKRNPQSAGRGRSHSLTSDPSPPPENERRRQSNNNAEGETMSEDSDETPPGERPVEPSVWINALKTLSALSESKKLQFFSKWLHVQTSSSDLRD